MSFDPVAYRLAAVVESSDDAIISQDLSGTVDTWNQGAARIFEYTAAEIVGRPAGVIVPPDRHDEEEWVLNRVRAGEAVTNFETVRLTRTGRPVDVSLTVSPVRSASGEIVGISKIARDITERTRLERQALQLAAIVNSSDDAIVSKTLDGTIQSWNRAAERMFGYTAEEAIGRSIRMIIPHDRQAEEDDVIAKLRRGEIVDHFETIRLGKDGRLVDISLTVSPIRNAQGSIVGASKIARDISAQKDLQRRLEAANRAKDEFLATVSHELRTPLNAVMGYARMLATDVVAEERRRHVVDLIERNARVLSQLVSDLLDLSSIVGGKMQIHVRPTDLTEIVHVAMDVVRPAAEGRRQTLTFHGDGGPRTIEGDEQRLQQVFWNLLMNAVKFTPVGGRIDVSLADRPGYIEVAVTDTGIGIRPELLPQVFERYLQGHGGPTREFGGLGLGLALVRHFVELHGGRATASSEGEGRGATFSVFLPIADTN